MEINTDQPFKALKSQVIEYIELQTEHTRLSLLEYSAKLISLLFTSMVIVIIISLIFFSVFISISIFIGTWLHNYGLGFLISAGLYILFLWCFLAFGKRKVQNYIIRKILELQDNEINNK